LHYELNETKTILYLINFLLSNPHKNKIVIYNIILLFKIEYITIAQQLKNDYLYLYIL